VTRETAPPLLMAPLTALAGVGKIRPGRPVLSSSDHEVTDLLQAWGEGGSASAAERDWQAARAWLFKTLSAPR